MREWLLNGIASLRTRLIITFMLVTVFSFGVLALVLMTQVERYLMQREETSLAWAAHIIGTTVQNPWRIEAKDWLEDQGWTQRRCADLANIIHARIRMLDAQGKVLVDSEWGTYEFKYREKWFERRDKAPNLAKRREVMEAMRNLGDEYATILRNDPDSSDHVYSMFIAKPIRRFDPNSGKNRLAVIMYINKPTTSVHNNLSDLRGFFGLGIVSALLVTILASVLLSSNLSAGLRSAMNIAREFAAGRMHLRMRETGRDEIGRLGVAFNHMADSLQRQEQLRRTLLADVSHELRTPLTAIAGCADTLADGALREDPDTAERFLQIIHKESARMQRLVADILELSRLQARAVEITSAPIDIIQVVDEAVEVARLRAERDKIILRWSPPALENSPALMVYGNEDRLAQVLRNLLDNARHFTPPGKSIEVSLDIHAEEVLIHVRDEGNGIAQEDLSLVFDRFYRSGKDANTGGSGLGLAIVREIMHNLGGSVSVQSTPRVGTTFSLRLSRSAQAEVADSEREETE